LAYITSSYTYINISYILSQHIGNIDIIIINTKTHVQHIWIQKICILIYIYIGLSGHLNVYIQKNISAHRPVPHLGTKNRLTSLSKRYTKIHHIIRGPLGHPQLPLPQEAVVAHPHLPQAVVVEHPQDHPAQAAGVHSSSQQAQLLAA
jgi:hypothetical protein